MNIHELIDRLQEIVGVEGQEWLDVFILDDDHVAFPVVQAEVLSEAPDEKNGLVFVESGATKGVCLIWL